MNKQDEATYSYITIAGIPCTKITFWLLQIN